MQSYKIGSTTVCKDSRFLRFQPSEADAYGWKCADHTAAQRTAAVAQRRHGSDISTAHPGCGSFRFQAGGVREVYLDGEAYFIVKEDAARPFIVHAGQADIQTTAGAFNANAYTATDVLASIVSGEATVSAGTQRSSPRPGNSRGWLQSSPLPPPPTIRVMHDGMDPLVRCILMK